MLKILSEDHLIKVMKACKTDRERAIVDVLLDTGIRLSELTRLREQDLDENSGVITVTGKGNKQRHAFLSDEAWVSLMVYRLF